MKKLAILVGGGPAPGINAVIAAATIEARNRGLQVLGCYHGFRWLVQGDTQHVVELDIGDVSRIHFEGGSILLTSRTNPTRSPEGVRRVAETLQRLGVQYLLTLGGDDTAFAASRIANELRRFRCELRLSQVYDARVMPGHTVITHLAAAHPVNNRIHNVVPMSGESIDPAPVQRSASSVALRKEVFRCSGVKGFKYLK